VTLSVGVAVATTSQLPFGLFEKATQSTPPSPKSVDDIDALRDRAEAAPRWADVTPPVVSQSRTAFHREVRGVDAEVVVAPAGSGLCLVGSFESAIDRAPSSASGCLSSLAHDWVKLSMVQANVDGRQALFGLVPDHTSTVQVRTTTGRSLDAAIGTNAYVWIGESATDIPAEIEYFWGSGAVRTIEIGSATPSTRVRVIDDGSPGTGRSCAVQDQTCIRGPASTRP
jgi:hypothetical protein